MSETEGIQHQAPPVPVVTQQDQNQGQQERQWAMFTHLSCFAGVLGIPFLNVIAPLVLWLMKKEQSPYIDYHGKEALNFQINITIYLVISVALLFVLIGFVLLPLLLIYALVFTIIASIKASEGVHYRYPLTIRFVK